MSFAMMPGVSPVAQDSLPAQHTIKQPRKGFLAALGAFVIWGLFPLYFHPLREVSSIQIIAHRVVWSCLFVLAWLGIRGEMQGLRATLADRSLVWRLAVSATLISTNWLMYVWGVTHGHVIETSLGYFIGPLVNVVLGVGFLAEKLSPTQWVAVALAVAGVGYLTVMTGSLPWIALALAFTFATYGLIRKVVKVDSLRGLATETVLLAPFAAAYLLWCQWAGIGALRPAATEVDALLIGSGPVTAIALFLFAYGTRLLPYSTVGVLQYLTPTLQFACGVFVLHEPFERTRTVGFTIIWAALLLYMGESLRLAKKSSQPAGLTARQ